MKENLGEQLRTVANKKLEEFEKKRKEEERKKADLAQTQGKAIADKIIADLPEQLKKALDDNRGYVVALESGYSGTFTPAQSFASYLIGEWARGEGLYCHAIPYERYEGGETRQALWISWKNFYREPSWRR